MGRFRNIIIAFLKGCVSRVRDLTLMRMFTALFYFVSGIYRFRSSWRDVLYISERKTKGTENREMILRACFVISTSLDPLAVLVEHIAFVVHDMQYGVHIKHAAADVVVCGIDRCKADGHI